MSLYQHASTLLKLVCINTRVLYWN